MTTTDRFYTTPELAAMWRVSAKTITRWAEAGRIPSITTPTGRRRYPRQQIDDLMQHEHDHRQETS